ncbi:acyl-CoA dehydrogenase [bacterium]|nr:acyl-CoA dehydrogenase [bacterium]
MAQQQAELRDIHFALFEQMQVEELVKNEKFSEFNKKMIEMIIKEARNFGLKEILPTYTEGDKQGVTFSNGKVKAPECFRKPFQLFREAEYASMTEDPEVGGQGLPQLVFAAVNEYLSGCNFSLSAYTTLGHGTGKMIELFGTEKQKELFLKKLYTAEWGGTMLLTEPDAGSDVGALTTSAKKNDDGTYSITGNKIFITSGDHDLTDNIIHPVLARIEGAPKGTKGISLFLVPKYWVNDDGSMGDANGIVCTGVEEKMGIHGSATCAMSMGASGDCRGTLLGEENKGMRVMFLMMNEARLGVGHQAFTHASAAYIHALNYARERIQGRALEDMMNHEAPSVPIIKHPDVRRMLLEMKSNVEGMRSFVYYVARCFDLMESAASKEEREKYEGLAELLTPILKTYNSNVGFTACVQAMQVFGGAGYTKDYPVEQLARDCKIASIYEGTDGIQAMDLLARKMPMKEGQIFMSFIQEIQTIIKQAKETKGLEKLAEKLEEGLNKLQAVSMSLAKTAMSASFKTAFAHSVPFLMVMGDITMCWMLLWRAVIASAKLEAGAKKKDADFYAGQIKNAEFFIYTILPVTMGKMASIEYGSNAAIEIKEESFGE